MDATHVSSMDDLDMNVPFLKNDQDTSKKIIYNCVYHRFVLCQKEYVHQGQLCVSKIHCE